MKSIDVAILVSYRFECLNVLLDILKLNFDKKIKTHVFCNLSKGSFEKYRHFFETDLIDFFHHIPDENCKEGIQVSTGHKQEVKRKQPLDALIKTLDIMSSKEVGEFIYTECDVFPLSQDSYLSELDSLREDCVSVRYIENVKSGKTPFGYMSPSPIYFSKFSASRFCSFLKDNRDQALGAQISFEGTLGYAAVKLSSEGLKFRVHSGYHTGNKTYDSNIEPVTLTTHQHNIFNLEKTLSEYGIHNGLWIEKIRSQNSMQLSWPTVNDCPSGILKKVPGFGIGLMKNVEK